MRPRDLLGPGLAGEVILGLQGRSVTGMEDLGDGSYRFRVPRSAIIEALLDQRYIVRDGRAIPSRDQIVLMSNDGAPCVS